VRIWGLPLVPWTIEQTVAHVDRLVRRARPSFFVTANLHYAMLCERDPRLRALNRRAAFLVADGMPLVWYSRLIGRRLPERIAGSDLIYALSRQAAVRGHRVFFLGGAEGVAQAAATVLARQYPGLPVAGVAAPMLSSLSGRQESELVDHIRRTRPDLLLVAFGQPKGERWLEEHLDALDVPVSVQLGASFDFVAGRVRRAPRWLRQTGLEWLYRMVREPRRLGPRYLHNMVFLARALCRDAWGRQVAGE
jgi:N-acetylglucosaminyldiphosphoundecaprenol N-acetyl-beta-D-mannosaminyltransferase